jgi:hypothetical protein
MYPAPIGIDMEANPYEMAQRLTEHEQIDGVQVDHNRMTVVHAPDESHVEKIPESMHEAILDAIEGTMWKTEYDSPGRNAERNSWSGGRTHNCVMRWHEQPAGYELQYHLVK